MLTRTSSISPLPSIFRAQVDPVVLFDATVQKKVTDRAIDIEV